MNRADTRNHNFDYLRLFLAIEVVAGHFWAGLLRPGYLWEPIPPVAAFVALSGFLIPQSIERSRNLGHFFYKRALRTLPALIPLFLAITLVFGRHEATGAIKQYLTAGYFGSFRGVVLPLWSLIVEDGLYAAWALLFLVGLNRKPWATVVILVALLAVDVRITDITTEYRLLETSISFFTGALIFHVHSRGLRLHWLWPALAVVALECGLQQRLGHFGLPAIVGSFLLLAISAPSIRKPIPDLSYGIYVWHAPIQLALLGYGMARDARWVVVASLVTLVASALSWYQVERRALAFKDVRLAPAAAAT